MRKLFQQIRKVFGFHVQNENPREMEVTYRIKMRQMENHLRNLERRAETDRQEAYRLEKQGKHTQAVRKAAEAQSNASLCKSMEAQKQSCELAHAQAESTRIIRDTYELMNEAGALVNQLADVEGLEKARQQNERVSVQLAQTNTQLDLISEGMDLQVETELQNEMGESALREIMEDMDSSVPMSEIRQDETSPSIAERSEWLSERRQALKDLIPTEL